MFAGRVYVRLLSGEGDKSVYMNVFDVLDVILIVVAKVKPISIITECKVMFNFICVCVNMGKTTPRWGSRYI